MPVKPAPIGGCSDYGTNAATYKDRTTPAIGFYQALWWDQGFCGSPSPHYCYVDLAPLGGGSPNWAYNDNGDQHRATCTNVTGPDNAPYECKGSQTPIQMQLMVKCAADIQFPDAASGKSLATQADYPR